MNELKVLGISMIINNILLFENDKNEKNITNLGLCFFLKMCVMFQQFNYFEMKRVMYV